MRYDITEKLKFDEDPVLVIKNVELTIKSDAENVLRLLDILSSKGEVAGATEALDILLSPPDRKKLSSLKLKTNDYVEVMKAAASLAMGEYPDEEDQGE